MLVDAHVEGVVMHVESVARHVEAVARRVERVAIPVERVAMQVEGVAPQVEGVSMCLELAKTLFCVFIDGKTSVGVLISLAREIFTVRYASSWFICRIK